MNRETHEVSKKLLNLKSRWNMGHWDPMPFDKFKHVIDVNVPNVFNTRGAFIVARHVGLFEIVGKGRSSRWVLAEDLGDLVINRYYRQYKEYTRKRSLPKVEHVNVVEEAKKILENLGYIVCKANSEEQLIQQLKKVGYKVLKPVEKTVTEFIEL